MQKEKAKNTLDEKLAKTDKASRTSSGFIELGTASTVGELRELINSYPNETIFGFRNQPQQILVELNYNNEIFVAFQEIK